MELEFRKWIDLVVFSLSCIDHCDSHRCVHYRYNPSASVVVAAPKKIKAGRELQLPSMSLLTSKTSSQQFFLRILKVIIQLRDAAKIQVKRTARRGGKCADGYKGVNRK